MTNYDDLVKSIKPAPPLPAATGKIVRVDTPDMIIRAIEDAEEGTTIVIAKGHYLMPRDCLVTTHHLTIRGETGNREDVVLDSGMEFEDTTPKYSTKIGAPAIIKITHARGVTIADLTVANNPKYGILFLGDGRVHDLKIYNVKFHNIWARGLKGTGAGRVDDHFIEHMDVKTDDWIDWVRPRGGEIRHCLFIADTPKQNDQDGFQGDYIAGMDLMNVDHFTIADCTFIGIRGKNGGGRGSVFIWNHSDNVVVENNHFYDCDKGISLGNPSGQEDKAYHIRNSVVRNNTIIGGSNKAIEIDYGDNIEITNNTIESDIRKQFAAIQVINISNSALVSHNTIRLNGEEPFNCDEKVRIDANDIETRVS